MRIWNIKFVHFVWHFESVFDLYDNFLIYDISFIIGMNYYILWLLRNRSSSYIFVYIICNEKLCLNFRIIIKLWNWNFENEWVTVLFLQQNIWIIIIIIIIVVIVVWGTLWQIGTIVALFQWRTHINYHIIIYVAKFANSVCFIEKIRISEIALITEWNIQTQRTLRNIT